MYGKLRLNGHYIGFTVLGPHKWSLRESHKKVKYMYNEFYLITIIFKMFYIYGRRTRNIGDSASVNISSVDIKKHHCMATVGFTPKSIIRTCSLALWKSRKVGNHFARIFVILMWGYLFLFIISFCIFLYLFSSEVQYLK